MKRATSWGRRHVAVMHMPSGRQHKGNFLHRLHGVLKEVVSLDKVVAHPSLGHVRDNPRDVHSSRRGSDVLFL